MKKLTLTYIKREEKISAPNPKYPNGRPYTSVSIKCSEYGTAYLSGFGNKQNENWKVGDTVEVLDVKEVIKNDKKYLNFEMPSKDSASNGQFEKVLIELSAIRFGIDKIKLQNQMIWEILSGKRKVETKVETTVEPVPEALPPEDYPF